MSERLTIYIFYVALVLTVLWAANGALGFAVNYYFYSSFLEPWKRALETYRVEGNPWPEFHNNHVEYMLDLTKRVTRQTGFRPIAADKGAFMYRLSKPGRADEHVLVLGQSSRMVVYGLTPSTAESLDRFADGKVDLASGSFRAEAGRSTDTIIVTWSY